MQWLKPCYGVAKYHWVLVGWHELTCTDEVEDKIYGESEKSSRTCHHHAPHLIVVLCKP